MCHLVYHKAPSRAPLLFIIYINDISSAISSNWKIFADDVTLHANVQTVQDCQILQADLNSISRWCDMWQLRLNPSKCEVLCITNKRSPLYFDYKIGGCSLHWSSSVKYLGIYINSKLNWNNLCAHVAAKATKILNLLRRHLFGCSLAAKYRAFRSLVLPILEYSSQVWNPHTQLNNLKMFNSMLLTGSVAVVRVELFTRGISDLINAVVN